MTDKHLFEPNGRTIIDQAFEASDGVIRALVANLVAQGYPPREIQTLLTEMVGYWVLNSVFDKDPQG